MIKGLCICACCCRTEKGYRPDDERAECTCKVEDGLGLLAATMSVREAVGLLATRLGELSHELDLAAQHKSNPGSTNGTLAQVSYALTEIANLMRRAL